MFLHLYAISNLCALLPCGVVAEIGAGGVQNHLDRVLRRDRVHNVHFCNQIQGCALGWGSL